MGNQFFTAAAWILPGPCLHLVDKTGGLILVFSVDSVIYNCC